METKNQNTSLVPGTNYSIRRPFFPEIIAVASDTHGSSRVDIRRQLALLEYAQ